MEKAPHSYNTDAYKERNDLRLYLGNAWMYCNECGAKLHDFDGDKDADRSCPYRKSLSGKCEPK